MGVLLTLLWRNFQGRAALASLKQMTAHTGTGDDEDNFQGRAALASLKLSYFGPPSRTAR